MTPVTEAGKRIAMGPDEFRERLRAILDQEGVNEPTDGIHGWRCRWPDRYGPCDCLDGLLDLIVVELSR